LHEENYPIAAGLEKLFPTLLSGEGMKYFEVKVDNTNGEAARSSKPLRVSIYHKFNQFVLAWMRFEWRTSSRRTQRYHGLV
jgi:hypothetical protein